MVKNTPLEMFDILIKQKLKYKTNCKGHGCNFRTGVCTC